MMTSALQAANQRHHDYGSQCHVYDVIGPCRSQQNCPTDQDLLPESIQIHHHKFTNLQTSSISLESYRYTIHMNVGNPMS